jgi:hypothetical protein
MTTSVDGGVLSRTGRGGGGGEATQTQRQPVATRRRPKIPAKHSRACALVPEPPGAAQYTGQLRISRGKQLLCEATLPGLSPGPGAGPPGGSQYTGAWRILRENNRNLKCGDVPRAITGSTWKCLV